MKFNSVPPNLICLACFPCSSLFVLSFTFSFGFHYAPKYFCLFIINSSFPSFFHLLLKNCVFSSPTIFLFFVPRYPEVSQTCRQNCSVLQSHSCSSQTLFHSTLIFKILIISEVLPIIWWTSALERIRPQPFMLRTEKLTIEKKCTICWRIEITGEKQCVKVLG